MGHKPVAADPVPTRTHSHLKADFSFPQVRGLWAVSRPNLAEIAPVQRVALAFLFMLHACSRKGFVDRGASVDRLDTKRR
jgi:hypothetical protein